MANMFIAFASSVSYHGSAEGGKVEGRGQRINGYDISSRYGIWY